MKKLKIILEKIKNKILKKQEKEIIDSSLSLNEMKQRLNKLY